MKDTQARAMVDLPHLIFQGREPLRFPGMIRALQAPDYHWPDSCLDEPFVEATVGRRRMVMITDPAVVTEMLRNRTGQFRRSRLHDRILGSSFGDTLLQGEQIEWPERRQAMLRPIHEASGDVALDPVGLACTHALSDWQEGPVDLLRTARHLTMQALWRAFFCDEAEARHSDPLLVDAANHMDRLAHAPLQDQIECLRPLGTRAVEIRTEENGDPDRLLNTTLLFLHAGHDNATATLTWALWLLARHPEIQQRVHDEWSDGTGTSEPGPDLRAVPLTSAVIHETLRLYPPIPQLLRDVTVDLPVDGQVVDKDFIAVLGIYAMHRHRRLWDRPDAFDPDRFMGKDVAAHRRLWLPFGAGPRGCVGTSFAFTVLSRAIGQVVTDYELIPNPGHDLTCRVDYTLRPWGRAPVRVTPRRPGGRRS